MVNVVFFSFKEEDCGVVFIIKGCVVNLLYIFFNFWVCDLLRWWKIEDEVVIK